MTPKPRRLKCAVPNALLFDRASLLNRLMGDEDLARTVLEGFLEDLPRQISGLEELLVAGDITGSQNRAHTIKGAAASVGGEAVRMAAAEMEQMARDGNLENMRRPFAGIERTRSRSYQRHAQIDRPLTLGGK